MDESGPFQPQFPISSRLLEVLLALEVAGSVSAAAKLLNRVPSVLLRDLKDLQETTGTVQKVDGKWCLSQRGREVNAISKGTLTMHQQILGRPPRVALWGSMALLETKESLFGPHGPHALSASWLSGSPCFSEHDLCIGTHPGPPGLEGYTKVIGALTYALVNESQPGSSKVEPPLLASASEILAMRWQAFQFHLPCWLPVSLLRRKEEKEARRPWVGTKTKRVPVHLWRSPHFKGGRREQDYSDLLVERLKVFLQPR